MTEYQITSWRVIPSMVVAREGDKTVKSQLPMRFQEQEIRLQLWNKLLLE
jgi:hypothetical protein